MYEWPQSLHYASGNPHNANSRASYFHRLLRLLLPGPSLASQLSLDNVATARGARFAKVSTICQQPSYRPRAQANRFGCAARFIARIAATPLSIGLAHEGWSIASFAF
jgi:hypothetical protein